MTIDASRLTHARDQLHWAAQILAATCDAVLPRRPDDSQSSLGWSDAIGALATHKLPSGHRLALRAAPQPSLLLLDQSDAPIESVPLDDHSLGQLIDWASTHLPDLTEHGDRSVELRDYDLPDTPFATGAPFEASDTDALSTIDSLWSRAFRNLGGVIEIHGPATPLLLWPHHFDIGAVLLLNPDDDPATEPCVGIGFSLGDASISEPYYYANPYAVERPDSLPAPAAGKWTDMWFGAVLTGSPAPDSVAALTASVTDITRSLLRTD